MPFLLFLLIILAGVAGFVIPITGWISAVIMALGIAIGVMAIIIILQLGS